MHRVAHYFGLTKGIVECWWERGQLMVGFRCSDCGRMDGVYESAVARGAIR